MTNLHFPGPGDKEEDDEKEFTSNDAAQETGVSEKEADAAFEQAEEDDANDPDPEQKAQDDQDKAEES